MAKQAIDSDVHVVGISTLAAAHQTLIPALIDHLSHQSPPGHQIPIICGGVIPESDIEYLKGMGVVEVFGPGTVVAEAACKVVELLMKQKKRNDYCEL